MAVITIVTRDDPSLTENTVKHVYTYNALTHPREGEYVEVKGKPPYVVDRVIHTLDNGNDNVVVEVKLSGRR